jgi:dTDP-4-dehydrorhamnose reductase
MVAPIKKVRWAITGGAGQLARSLTDLLDMQGVTYRAWVKKELDISRLESASQIKEFSPSIIVNCAAWTNVDGAENQYNQALAVNRDGARNVSIIAKELGIPLIHISTDYVFSGNSKWPWRVEDETSPTSKYGETKLLGELQVLGTWPQKSLILRTAWLYGPYGKNFAKTIVKKVITTKDLLRVVHDQKGQPTTTFDLALRIFECVNAGIPFDIYHATNSEVATWWDFAKELTLLSGESVHRIIPVSSEEFPSQVKRPSYSVLDHSSWSKVGLSPMRDWREALREIYPSIRKSVESELSNG